MKATLETQLKLFAQILERERRVRYLRNWPNSPCVDAACTVKIRPGKKYTKVDVGESGVYMVVNETGEIYGIKAYGVIHRGHKFGTLDTLLDWDWSDYRAVPKGQIQHIQLTT